MGVGVGTGLVVVVVVVVVVVYSDGGVMVVVAMRVARCGR
jgi:hypothetical protein